MLAGCSAGAKADDAPAPGQAATSSIDRLATARVGMRDLELVATGDSCALKAGGNAIPLGLTAPCGFLRPKAAAAAWVQDYGKQGAVVLIGGASATTGDFAGAGRTPADGCADTGRAVIVADGKIALSEVKQSPLWFCPDAAPDEKFYYSIAHERSFAQRTPVG